MTTQDFAQAYTRNYPRTERFLASRGISKDQAEEVAQAAWSRGWERIDELREMGKIGPWVNTIALNLLRRHIQKNKRNAELKPNLDRPTESTASERVDAGTLLQSMSEEDRRLFVMHAVEGCTSKEISERCSLSPVAVRVRLSRARARIQRELSAHGVGCRTKAA